MFGQMLVPLDGSFRAEQAPPVAARIARATGGSLLLVQVVTPPVDYSGGLSPVPIGTGEVVEEEMKRATDYLLRGEAEAHLDGQPYHLKAGDGLWTGVGSTHGFLNCGTTPIRWLETQAPQPPDQQSLRFPGDWEYLEEKLSSEEESGLS